MALLTVTGEDLLPRIDSYQTLIDARSESEFALDHLPGAVNWPSLDDEQRSQVGTEYKQVSPFDARKRGAAMAARNIAAHIEREVMDKPRDWAPLVYCWRGGKRSGSLALVLDQIGFKVTMLEGGYREYRRAIVKAIDDLSPTFDFRVICGTTGSGKSRLLQELRSQGAQVLDLEHLANHRGSVLGLVPGSTQPGQKRFESSVWDALRKLDPQRPVFVESESKKVGDLRVPERLMERIRASACIPVELSLEARVNLLMDDYDFFVKDTAAFCERLDALRMARGHDVVSNWQREVGQGHIADVVRALLVEHYDPIYLQSIRRNFQGVTAPHLTLQWDGSAESLRDAAAHAIAAG